MANAVFPTIKEYVEGAAGLDWLNGKFKVYGVDMANAGPAAGAWMNNSLGFNVDLTFNKLATNTAHGAVAGDRVALFGVSFLCAAWEASKTYPVGSYVSKPTPNGKRYRMITGTSSSTSGTSGASQPTWPTSDGQTIINGSCVWMCDGSEMNSPLNGNWTISSVPSSAEIAITEIVGPAYKSGATPVAYGYIANLSKTYLSDFAPSGSRVESAALIGKSVLPGGVLDASDYTLDGGSTMRHALVLAKAAALDADADLADTAQRLVAYWDTMPGLPIAASLGPGLFAFSNSADRAIHL